MKTTARQQPGPGLLRVHWILGIPTAAIFAIIAIAPSTVSGLVGNPRRGVIAVLILGVVGCAWFGKLWNKGVVSWRLGAFLALLPMLALVSTKLRIGMPPYSYGLDLFACSAFVLFFRGREEGGALPRRYSVALWLYVSLCLVSAIATEFSTAAALDHWLILVALPAMFFYAITQKAMTAEALWWPLLGIVAAGAITVASAFVFFTGNATWTGYDASAALQLDSYLVGQQAARVLIGGPLGAGTVLARIYVISIPICVGLLLRKRVSMGLRAAVLAVAGLMGYVVLIGQSRSAIIGIGAGIAVLLATVRAPQKWLVIGGAAVVALVFSGAIVDYLERRPIISRSSGNLVIDSSNRLEVAFPIALNLFLENPAFGIGPGEANYVAASLAQGKGLRHAHNMFLQLLSDRGAPATLLFLFLLFGAMWRALSRARETMDGAERLLWCSTLGALVGFVVYSQAEPIYALDRGAWHEILAWALLAIPFIPIKRS